LRADDVNPGHSQVLRLGGKNIFLEEEDSCFYYTEILKQVFLGTTKFGGVLPEMHPSPRRRIFTLIRS